MLHLIQELHKSKRRKGVSVANKSVALACDFLLKFDCDFINTYAVWILISRKFTKEIIKVPLASLSVLNTILEIKELIEGKDNKLTEKAKKELMLEIIGKIASLVIDLITILTVLRLCGKRADAISTILLILVLQPITCYCDFNKDDKSSLYFDVLNFVLIALGFYFYNIRKTQDVPIVLSANVIYTFNLGAVSYMLAAFVSICSTLYTLWYALPDNPGTGFGEGIDIQEHTSVDDIPLPL
ncbi:hypothetical protein BIY23_00065 [Wolbachia pipientis]|uniref:Uncharacterized protein n=1 Tax=Wolbachia pipientis TaxID=955 RepID=A0A1E7QK91_WOLPI|nr:hypothetical protein [Wolbachia pipientis]OEY86895.1 hypothetical protein BIY23_00065 [Wolbachia pipientis]